MKRYPRTQIIYLFYCIFGNKQVSKDWICWIFFILKECFEIDIIDDFKFINDELVSYDLREVMTMAVAEGLISPNPDYENQSNYYSANKIKNIKYCSSIEDVKNETLKSLLKIMDFIISETNKYQHDIPNLYCKHIEVCRSICEKGSQEKKSEEKSVVFSK